MSSRIYSVEQNARHVAQRIGGIRDRSRGEYRKLKLEAEQWEEYKTPEPPPLDDLLESLVRDEGDRTVREIIDESPHLSNREREVMKGRLEGLTLEEIGKEIGHSTEWTFVINSRAKEKIVFRLGQKGLL